MPAECELRLTEADAALFAAASGDRNPLHLDREFAAGTPFGSPIAHGSLIAIAMLGALPDRALSDMRSLRVSFSGAIQAGTAASLDTSELEGQPGAWEIRLTARGRTVARLLARPVSEPAPSGRALEHPDGPLDPMRVTPAEPCGAGLDAGRALQGAYEAAPELVALAERLGAGGLDRRLLEGLAWASYVVGMEIPGLHSLFAGVKLTVDEGGASVGGGQTLLVRGHDERTGQLTIDGALEDSSGGRVLATIQCFALAPAVPPDPSALGLDGKIDRDRGAVVVVGGSRGFGASLALALLALGYDVHVGYATSRQRAEELLQLAGARASHLHLTQLDARDPEGVQTLADRVAAAGRPLVGLVLSAAPPPLGMGLTPASGAELADYVAASLRLVAVPLGGLLPSIQEPEGWVLFCSSAALSAPPRDWPHYVTAKAAVEGLASWVAKTRPRLHTVVVRPPKMLTAMSGTPSGRIGAASADEIALWTASKLAGENLEPGLTMLEPDPREAAAA
jgi:NAD(P)-dependent dehydrogenase (short-subunit alcohol dehydrogenase family)